MVEDEQICDNEGARGVISVALQVSLPQVEIGAECITMLVSGFKKVTSYCDTYMVLRSDSATCIHVIQYSYIVQQQ